MLFTGLLLSTLLGASTLLFLSRKLTLLEWAGLSFPVGIGVQTILMIGLDALHIRLTAGSVLAVSLLPIVAYSYRFATQRKAYAEYLLNLRISDFRNLNLLWAAALLLLIGIEALNFAKCIYYPTFDNDSVVGFDLIAKHIAGEGTLARSSLFTGDNFSFSGAGSYLSYTPLVQCSYAYLYLLGAAGSKLVNALFYPSFMLAFYGFCRRYCSPTVTALVTLFAFATPEMLSFSSLSGQNVIHAFYATFGMLYLCLYLDNRERSFLHIAILAVILNVWTRNEGLAFIGGGCAVLLLDGLKRKQYRDLLLFFGCTVASFFLWNLFLRLNALHSDGLIRLLPFWDGERIARLASLIGALFANTGYYGFSFVLFAILLLCNFRNVLGGDRKMLLIQLFVSLLLYTLVVYQMDNTKFDTLENVVGYSYKRFLFSFIPAVWFYIGSNRIAERLSQRLDRFVDPERR